MKPPFLNKIVNSPLIKNNLVLYGKFYFDKLFKKKSFLFYGKSISTTSHCQLPPQNKRRIVFPTIFFLDRALGWQAAIARTLEVRGHEVIFMPLDLHFPKRNGLYFDQDWNFMSNYHNLYSNTLLNGFSFQIQPYSFFGKTRKFWEYRKRIEKFDGNECKNFMYNNLPLGKMTLNNVIHYFRCSPENLTPKIIEAYKDYLAMGMVLSHVISYAFDKIKPDIIFTLNGSFLDSQLQLALAKSRNIRVVTFEAGFMLNTLMFGANEPIIEFPMAKYLPDEYNNYHLKPHQEKQLDDYLRVRSMGKDCVFDYWGNPIFDHKKIRSELGLNEKNNPDILFTNLLWDSALLDCDIGFKAQSEWIFETIIFYQKYPEKTLLIRIHPAEINPPFLESKDKIQSILAKKFNKMPKNVIIIPPTSSISSYPLTEISDKVLIYSSTAGLEAAIMGKSVVVAGKTHYRNQGFTHDIQTKDQYIKILEAADLTAERGEIIRRSRTYAYFFFFGFMIPFNQVTERTTTDKAEQVSFNFTSEEQLLPGQDEQLDLIIDFILDKSNYASRLKKIML